MIDTKTYTHENGYSAILYGQSSMSIQKDGKEVMHTGSRNVNSEKEVIELLERIPKLLEVFKEINSEEEQ